VDAVHQAFAHDVAQTSLVGGIIMAAGAMIVLANLPGRKATAAQKTGRQTVEPRSEQQADQQGPQLSDRRAETHADARANVR
jgi:hypothetical protein